MVERWQEQRSGDYVLQTDEDEPTSCPLGEGLRMTASPPRV
jgi:hypothetical protein